MREIKFKSWDTENKRWLNSVEVSAVISAHQRGEKALLYPLMQFTGLHDKNGKEIYDGDLISESGSKPYEVVWQFHSVQWIMQSTQEGRTYRGMAYDYAKMNYEVIGNIYENPELL